MPISNRVRTSSARRISLNSKLKTLTHLKPSNFVPMIKLLERTRRPDITFCRNGRISITARVVRMLSLQPGDSINIAFHLGECYLLPVRHAGTPGRHHAQCYPTKKGSRNYCANSVMLARLMLDNCGIKEQRASFMIGQAEKRDGETVLPIIFKHPL